MRFILPAALLLAACGSDAEDDPVLPPSLELGTGEVEFESIDDGDDVWVIQGPQGGFHILGSIRVTGVERGDPDDLEDPDNPTTEFQVYRGTERLDVLGARYTQGLDRFEPGVYGMIGRFVILDIIEDDEVAGDTLHVTVDVTDVNGVQLSDELDVVAVPHPQNP